MHAVRHGVGVPLNGVAQTCQHITRRFGAADDDDWVLRAMRHEDGCVGVGGTAFHCHRAG